MALAESNPNGVGCDGAPTIPSVTNETHQSKQTAKQYHLIAQSSDIQGYENFPMGCRWAPDGTCVLTATSADGRFRLYDTPFRQLSSANGDVASSAHEKLDEQETNEVTAPAPSAHTNTEESSCYSHNENFHAPSLPNGTKSLHQWNASLTSHQGGPPPPSSSSSYSFYPLFNSSSPTTAIYATCRGRSLPIHLIDAYTSALRASYCPHNNVDELEGPTVVEFSPDGRRIYGTGFKSDRTIAVFDTSIPGREGQILRLGKTRRSADGQKGIPSAIAFPKCSGGNGPSNVFAIGTYSPASIYIYDDRTASGSAGTIVLHGGLTVVGHGKAFSRKKRRFANVSDSNNDAEQEENWFSSARVNWFQSQARGGVTQLMWAPPASSNSYILYSASRRSNAVLSWDVRMLSCDKRNAFPICGLKSYSRGGDTNQRIGFDLNYDGSELFTGSTEGVVNVYDTNTSTLNYEIPIENHQCNGVSHINVGSKRLLAVTAGARQFDEESDDEDKLSTTENQGTIQLYSIDG